VALLLIGYDLNREGPNYSANNKRLRDKISEMFGTRWNSLDSTWLVVTDMEPLDVANALWAVMDGNDELLVAPIAPGSAYAGFNEKSAAWLEKHL